MPRPLQVLTRVKENGDATEQDRVNNSRARHTVPDGPAQAKWKVCVGGREAVLERLRCRAEPTEGSGVVRALTGGRRQRASRVTRCRQRPVRHLYIVYSAGRVRAVALRTCGIKAQLRR